jgi:putative PLP-dependent aminotransferase (TIGR04422 family)
LIYHQWGFVGQSYFSKETLLIEDAVDHLFLPGHTPFAADARFLLWSLPKVLGTSGGGVVFCRDGRDAEDLRRIRQDRPSSWFQAILRIKSKTDPNVSLYWNGAEAMQGELVAPFRRQVYRCLREIRELAESRMQFMETLSPTLAKKFQGLHRLPSNLPLVPISDIKPYWGSNAIFSAGLRSFNTACAFPRANWVQCAPLPVHKDVDLSDLPIEFLSADIEAMLISI